jgi:hypothetical protein
MQLPIERNQINLIATQIMMALPAQFSNNKAGVSSTGWKRKLQIIVR